MPELTLHTTPGVSPFDAIRRTRPDNTEYWSARDLWPMLGYSTWQKFQNAIERAERSLQNTGHDTAAHITRSVKNPSDLGGRPATDYELTRYAAYVVVMNADPNMPEVAAAQGYFAVKTREAEIGAAVTPQQSITQSAASDAQALMAVIHAAQGLIHPDHLEAKARVVLARALGEEPQLDPGKRPVYVQDFLKDRDELTSSEAVALSGQFGKWLKKTYLAERGHAPDRHVQTLPNGQTRDVYAYTENDRELMDRAWWAFAINKGIGVNHIEGGNDDE